MTYESLADLQHRVATAINDQGHILVTDVLPKDFIRRAKAELEIAIASEQERYGEPARRDFGMVMLCSLYKGTFIELLSNEKFLAPFEAVLGPGCIVYAYTSSSMPPTGTNYSSRIHVDCPRLIPGYVTNVGATILLDDFTEENGATWYLPCSHTRAEAPSTEEFFQRAARVVAPAGSVFYFNARLWHFGGANSTPKWRHALTLNMCRPYMKQRIDIPRAMKNLDMSKTPQRALQKLGFLSQPPASVEEYYLPHEQRSFRQSAE